MTQQDCASMDKEQ